MLPWSPRGRSGGRSRHGICLRMSGCRSRICARPGRGCGRSRNGWAAARRRSAASCGVTVTRAAGGTGRSPRTSWPLSGGPGPGRARSPATRRCASSCRTGWGSGGVRSRSAGRCARSSRARRCGMWCTRPSTRRSTALSWVACPASCRPGCCRTGRRRRRPHRRPGERRPDPITAMTMIGQRPAGAAARSEPGHWEGDLITGASNRSAIGTLVDRASRFTILLHLPGRHTAEAVRDALIAAMASLPPQLRLADLGSGQGDGAAPGGHRRAGDAGVLLRQGQPVAASVEREHERAAPPGSPRAATCTPTARMTWPRSLPS